MDTTTFKSKASKKFIVSFVVIALVILSIILFFVLNRVRIYFPPAGAILLIPLILDKKLLFAFPPEVFTGAVILTAVALALFKEPKNNKVEN